MGNSSTSKPIPNDNHDPNMDDDFEPIDKPSSPAWMPSSSVLVSTSANDLTTSGILVERADHEEVAGDVDHDDGHKKGRRIVKASKQTTTAAAAPFVVGGVPTSTTTSTTTSTVEDGEKGERLHSLPIAAQSDQELLEESLVKAKQIRLTKLQQDQKVKRNKAVDERRKGEQYNAKDGNGGGGKRSGGGIVAMANPFSRFLSAFSVEPKFPAHKRPYEPSDSELNDAVGVWEPKRAKIDPHAADDDENDGDNQSVLSIVQDWCNLYLPLGWPWMAAAVAATGLLTVVVMASTRSKPPRRTW